MFGLFLIRAFCLSCSLWSTSILNLLRGIIFGFIGLVMILIGFDIRGCYAELTPILPLPACIPGIPEFCLISVDESKLVYDFWGVEYAFGSMMFAPAYAKLDRELLRGMPPSSTCSTLKLALPRPAPDVFFPNAGLEKPCLPPDPRAKLGFFAPNDGFESPPPSLFTGLGSIPCISAAMKSSMPC